MSTGLECDPQKNPVNHRELYIPDIKMGRHGWVCFGRDIGNGFFGGTGKRWVEADDRILRRELIVGHFKRPVAMQYRLKPVHGLDPSEILNVAKRLCEVPRNDDSISQFLHIAMPGHSWF